MRKLYTRVSVVALAAVLALAACGGATYGKSVTGKATTTVAAVGAEGKAADGKHAVVEGKVAAVCPSGCWIDVADPRGNTLHVTVGGDYALPQTINGKTVRAEGDLRFSAAKDKVELVAAGIRVL